MKRIFRAVASLMFGVAAIFSLNAQQIPSFPMDSTVVTGTLPNGLTYYIRHNETPKGQADFHIAQKVGSILEEDNQRGLAHFLEHMCFNGTKNYPGNSLISYLESIGVKFGSHLNAYTGADETVYKITNVPTARTEVTDSVLLILHDWADALLLDGEEIDKERGVIHEEWRQRNVGQMRILDQLLPTVYPGSKYAYRMPIGTMEVVDNFPHQALRDYYEAWYRPDLQGIIVVGDIDVERTERVIKEMFGDIEMPQNAPERVEFEVPDTPGTIYAFAADPEQTNSIVYIMFKQNVLPRELRNTPAYTSFKFITTMIQSMLNTRFNDLTMSNPDVPFAVAYANYDHFLLSSTKDAFSVITAAKADNVTETVKWAYREVLRAKRGGFTQGEYERAKAEYLASLEKSYNNRASMENEVYTQDIIRHFIDGTPLTDSETEYQTAKQMAAFIDINTINDMFAAMIADDNRVVLGMLPESITLPSESEILAAMQAVDAEEIEAFTDNVREDPLVPSLAAPGTIVSATPVDGFDNAEIWTLSNGARVILMPTTFKNDEIIFSAVAGGGLSQVYTTVSPSDGIALSAYATEYGIGAYSNSDLQKYLAGKKASIRPTFRLYTTEISGSTTPKDLPVFMELLYGYFTSVNYPVDEFEAVRSLYGGLLQNQENNPQFVFQRDMRKTLYPSPYLQTLTAADFQACTCDGISNLVRSRVADASQWDFVFVGNLNKDEMKAFCEQYIASLPSTSSPRQSIDVADDAYTVAAGSGTEVFKIKMEVPQTWCAIVESASMPFNSVNAKMISIAGQILSARLLKTIREEMGAVYSIGAQGDITPQVGQNVSLMTAFPMNPDKKNEVLESIANEIDAMAVEITDEELNKVKEYMLKSYVERQEQNSSLANYIAQWASTGVNTLVNAEAEVNAITAADIQNFVKEMNAQGNYRVVILEAEP